jgi:hypothetical protein
MAVASACSDPTAPSAKPSPTPAPSLPVVRLQMSGRVMDESGAPIPDALVEVNYSSAGGASNPPSNCPTSAQFCWFALRTNAMGDYAVEFQPRSWPGRGLGFVYSFGDGYEVDVQWVPVGPNPAVRNMNLRTTRTIVAGDSTVVTVDPASSLCTDLEDNWALESRCEIVVIESSPGTLNLEARAVSGGVVPLIWWYTTGNYNGFITRPGPGAVSIPVRGGTYRILVGIPEGTPRQQFNVTTSLR